MNRDDWIFVGCRLFGLYLGVQGLISVVMYGCYVIEEYARGIQDANPLGGPILPVDLYRMAYPVCYLVFAYLLTHRTEWCIQMITPQRREASAPQLEED